MMSSPGTGKFHTGEEMCLSVKFDCWLQRWILFGFDVLVYHLIFQTAKKERKE